MDELDRSSAQQREFRFRTFYVRALRDVHGRLYVAGCDYLKAVGCRTSNISDVARASGVDLGSFAGGRQRFVPVDSMLMMKIPADRAGRNAEFAGWCGQVVAAAFNRDTIRPAA